MDAITRRAPLHRPSGLRGGIIIGLALALVGGIVGTATGAVTPFQLVIVKNTAAEPVPVTGTVNVGNTPANQSVTVSNFPATQPVTMAAIAPEQVADKYFGQRFVANVIGLGGDPAIADFEGTINVTTLTVGSENDTYDIILITASGKQLRLAKWKEDNFALDFSKPVPATGVRLECRNTAFTCHLYLSVMGY